MNLVEAIIKRTGLESKKEEWSKEYYLLSFFLKENIETLFGNTTFAISETDMDRTFDSMKVYFNDELYLITLNSLGSSFIEMVCTKEGVFGYVPVFEIKIDKTEATNHVTVKDSLHYEYYIDLEKELFSFSKYGTTPTFSATMQPMNVGRRQASQLFSLRIMDEGKEEQTILKRIFFQAGKTVRLPIRANDESTILFADEVFSKLKALSDPIKDKKEKRLIAVK